MSELLKPDAWKLASPVSRGEGGSNASDLPYTEVVYESPKTILGKLKAIEDEIRIDLDELADMLN